MFDRRFAGFCRAAITVTALTLPLVAPVRFAQARALWGNSPSAAPPEVYSSASDAASDLYGTSSVTEVTLGSRSLPDIGNDDVTINVVVLNDGSTGNHLTFLMQFADGSVYAEEDSGTDLGDKALSTTGTLTIDTSPTYLSNSTLGNDFIFTYTYTPNGQLPNYMGQSGFSSPSDNPEEDRALWGN